MTSDENEGAGFVERAGWQEDAENGKRFTATVAFPLGPPAGFTWATVWDKHPVRLVNVPATPQPEPGASEDDAALAEAVHIGRFGTPDQATPFAEEDRNGREYCFRIARQVKALLARRGVQPPAGGAVAEVECVPGRLGGRPCIKGRRIAVAQMIANIADGNGPKEYSKDWDVDEDVVRRCLHSIADNFDALYATSPQTPPTDPAYINGVMIKLACDAPLSPEERATVAALVPEADRGRLARATDDGWRPLKLRDDVSDVTFEAGVSFRRPDGTYCSHARQGSATLAEALECVYREVAEPTPPALPQSADGEAPKVTFSRPLDLVEEKPASTAVGDAVSVSEEEVDAAWNLLKPDGITRYLARRALQAAARVRSASAADAVETERKVIAAEARRYAGHYPQSSDGRNTFTLLAEWVEARTATPAQEATL